ncbi:MAG: SusD/RagB family nutrient-binding outer membrane lipoprotein [Longimicrobiales bacterium]
MHKFKPSRLLMLMSIPLFAACGDLLDLDINTDPNAATEVQPDLLMPTVLANLASVRAIEISPGNAFHAQIWASNGSTGVFNDPERYIISSFTSGNTWQGLYASGLKNLTLMRDQALGADPARNNVAAQAEIMSAYIFWMGTALWETIPYTQALDGVEFPQPEFDDQETVLRGLVAQLDAAVAMMDDSPPVEGGDLIYKGNMENWERFANSLKLRILMMLRNRDASVDAQIQQVLTQPLIRDNSQEAAIPFFTTTSNENNLWRLNNMFGGFTDAMNGNGFVFAGAAVVDLMKELGDPRLSTYWELAVNSDGDGYQTDEYFGQEPGVFSYGDETSSISQNIIRRDWPSRMVTAAEVWLHEAEFLATTTGPAAAEESFNAGVRAGLDYFDGHPGAISEAEKDAYIASLPAATQTAIWAQQYIEVFDRAPENWTQWRRTHYPDLSVPEQAALGDIIRRYPLPPDELSANPNAPSQIPLDQPMWFEPTN